MSGGIIHWLSALKYEVNTVEPVNPPVGAVKPTVRILVALISNPM